MDYEWLLGPLMAHDQDCSVGRRFAYDPTPGVTAGLSACAHAQCLMDQSFIKFIAGSPEMLWAAFGYEEHVCSFDLLNWMAYLFTMEGSDDLLERMAFHFSRDVLDSEETQ